MIEKIYNDLDSIGLEMTRDSPKLFPEGVLIYVKGAGLMGATVISKHGLTGQRLERKVVEEEKTHLEFDGQIIKLPDLEVRYGKLHRYVLLDQKAFIFINKLGVRGNKPITRGFLFWGH